MPGSGILTVLTIWRSRLSSYFKFNPSFLEALFLDFLSAYTVCQIARTVLFYGLRLMFILVRMPSTFIHYFIFLLTTGTLLCFSYLLKIPYHIIKIV